METDTSLSTYSGKVTCERQWKPIRGYEGLYEVSDYGDVRSLDREVIQGARGGSSSTHIYKGQMLKPRKQYNGYMTVNLAKNGTFQRVSIHRLVGYHYLEKPSGKDCINHLDGNPENNHVSNLEWCTQSENIQYAYDKGTKTPPHQKKVGQFDLDGNLIAVWISEAEASRSLGLHQSNIGKVCRGERNQTGGYIWRFIK